MTASPGNRLVVISGCSGGGKSTLLEELRRRGHAVVEEPGRRVVRQELRGDGAALSWVDPVAFARRALLTALADRASARGLAGPVFFDRCIVDAAAALEHLTGDAVLAALGAPLRYHARVFLAPPWREHFAEDGERRHTFDAAVAEYRRLDKAYRALRYEVRLLPKMGVAERADFVLAAIAE